MRTLLRSFIFIGILALSVPAFTTPSDAADTKTLPNRPSDVDQRNTPVAVEMEGTDSIGARLATRLKETFNASNLFTLNSKDTPKLRVLIATAPEFPSRPSVGSAYSIVWLFSQSEGTLRHFLMHETGVVSAEDVDALAAKIAERTDGLAVRYGYLFQ